MYYAKIWELYANITIVETNNVSEATIRVTFDPDLGSFSYIGQEAKSIKNLNECTMNLGWFVSEN